MSGDDNLALLRRAVDWRQGIVARVQEAPSTRADVPVFHAVALDAPYGDPDSAAGGAGWTADDAERAAIGEALERYAGWATQVPRRRREEIPPGELVVDADRFSLFSAEQRRAGIATSVSADTATYVRGRRLSDGAVAWLPSGLVTLDGTDGDIGTSNGLAAGPSLAHAMLRGIQEIVERDALMTVWLHGIGPPALPLPEALAAHVELLGGRASVLDLTPAWSPHPVVAVAGEIPVNGRPRPALGCACRSNWPAAVDKAFLEWAQGITFAGFVTHRDPDGAVAAADVTTFAQHGAYYAYHLDEWRRLPLWSGPSASAPPDTIEPAVDDPSTVCDRLVTRLADAGIELYSCVLTTEDVAACGVSVVRVVSPQLVPINADHGRPFLGGTAADASWRYPDLASTVFPSPHPHPLG